MTVFNRSWTLMKSDIVRSSMERVLTPEEIQDIAQYNYDVTRGNPMVWDYDMTAMFPRECRSCPNTITDFVTGIPTDNEHGICSVCMNPSIDEKNEESMMAEGFFGLSPDDFKEHLEGVKRGKEIDESSVDFGDIGSLNQKRFRDQMEGYE
jgi:hypothetical protein